MDTWAFLDGDGEALRLIHDHDWTTSSLGPPDVWPHSLKTLINVTLQSRQPAFVTWGAQRILFYNDAYIGICGHRHPAIGRPFDEVWADIADQAKPLMDQAYSGRPLHIKDMAVHNMQPPPNDVTYFTFSYTPIRDDQGEVSGVFCHCMDTTAEVTSRTRSQNERRRLANLFDQAPGFMALLTGPEHRFAFGNAEYMKLVNGRDIIGKTVAEAIPEAAEQGYLALLDQVYNGETYRGQASPFDVARGDGTTEKRYVDFVYQPIREANGEITGIFVQGYDVTEHVQSEERYRLLLGEMNHRVKNMFAVVASLLALSARRATSVQELVAAMRQKIRALSQAHNLITTSFEGGHHDDYADLEVLLRTLLIPYAGAGNADQRLRLGGSKVALKGQAISVLTLILHELATNAAKYGALSSAAGTLSATWHADGDGLRLQWLEEGGPAIVEAPAPSGFGTTLTNAMSDSLGASIEQEWHQTGLRVTLTIPGRHIWGF